MPRTLGLLALLAVLLPLGLVAPPAASAAITSTTIVTTDRNTGRPLDSVCYSAADLDQGGSIGGGCDWDDGANDGTTTVTSEDPCGSCRFTQSLPDDHETGLPTEYVLAPPKDRGWGGTVTFQNFPKPYLIVTSRDARSGALLPGVCIGVTDLDRGGGADGVCDGGPNDPDGLRNGRMQTKRLNPGRYRVSQTVVPADYTKGAPVNVAAVAGQVHRLTVEAPPRPRIRIRTVAAGSGALLKGVCYGVVDVTHGGGVGTFCDGASSDADGRLNGTVVTKPLQPATLYRLHQSAPPAGFRPVLDQSVRTVAGEDAAVTFTNQRSD